MNVVIIGAGLAGLSAALRLRSRHDVLVLEREPTVGGKVRSQRIGGFIFDWGPNGFQSNSPELSALVAEAGLEDALVEASPAASQRSIYWQGKLHALPSKPSGALATSLLSARGKVRALAELFARPSQQTGLADEDVDAFFTRHFGREVAERIVAPALLGISGGDAKHTSLAALFPNLAHLEQRYGSLIRGLMRNRGKRGRLVSFAPGGLQRLTDALASTLGDRLQIDCEATSIEPNGQAWRVYHRSGYLDADAVVLCTPAYVAAQLLMAVDEELSALLSRIEYAPMRVAGIAFRERDVPAPLDGFGFLVARGQGVRMLGALYTSTIFPDQAPEKTAYLRIFLGGETDPEIVGFDGDRTRALVCADLAATLGIRAEPVAYHEIIWPHAIPQYAIGHRDLVASIDERVSSHRGVALAGNAYRGLGVADTVRGAWLAADRLS